MFVSMAPVILKNNHVFNTSDLMVSGYLLERERERERERELYTPALVY